jgi:transcriptional/translational regulatory protein YebC/TACO1
MSKIYKKLKSLVDSLTDSDDNTAVTKNFAVSLDLWAI